MRKLSKLLPANSCVNVSGMGIRRYFYVVQMSPKKGTELGKGLDLLPNPTGLLFIILSTFIHTYIYIHILKSYVYIFIWTISLHQ